MALSPLNQRRWRNFKANRRALWSLGIMAVLYGLSLMAELLATSDGAGAQLAATRSHLDMGGTLAWVSAVVGLLLVAEYLLLEPIRREMERWRGDTGGAA